MPTLDDVVDRAAIFLGAKGVGMPLSAEDGDLIKSIARNVIDELSFTVTVPNYDDADIPEEVVIPLAQRIAVDCAPAFGVTLEFLASQGISQFAAEARLRRVTRSGASDAFVIKADYF